MTGHQDEPVGVEALRSAAVTQAIDWFIRHRGGVLSPADKQAFMEWLSASPLNVGEYLEAARLAEDLPAVVAQVRAAAPDLLARIRKETDNVVSFTPASGGAIASQRRTLRSRNVVLSAAGAFIAVFVGVLSFWRFAEPGWAGIPREIVAPRGEQRTVELRDGSIVYLNTDTKVVVRYSHGRRSIEFERGQALFQVARDAARPFSVRTGNSEVIAVGTQFQVYRKVGGEVVVTVVEGKVDVVNGDGVAAQSPGTSKRRLSLVPGEQVQVSAGGLAAKTAPADLRSVTAWVQREVVFKERPLSEVAQEFGRYSNVRVVIDDPALRALEISGIFRAYDIESFLGYLRQISDVDVQREGAVIRVRRRNSGAGPKM